VIPRTDQHRRKSTRNPFPILFLSTLRIGHTGKKSMNHQRQKHHYRTPARMIYMCSRHGAQYIHSDLTEDLVTPNGPSICQAHIPKHLPGQGFGGISWLASQLMCRTPTGSNTPEWFGFYRGYLLFYYRCNGSSRKIYKPIRLLLAMIRWTDKKHLHTHSHAGQHAQAKLNGTRK